MTTGYFAGWRIAERDSLVTEFVHDSGTTEQGAITITDVTEKPSLADLVEAASTKHNGASGRRLADVAAEAGFDVSHTTLNRIRSGTYSGAPSPATIKAIAWLAGVAEEEAFRAAGQNVPGTPFASVLPPGVDNLGPSERRAVVEVLRAFTQHHQREWDRGQREWSVVTKLMSNIAESLRETADLYDWVETQIPEDQIPTFRRMMSSAAGPLVSITDWYGEYVDTVADELKTSFAARAEINEMFTDAVAALRQIQKGDQGGNTMENATESDAPATDDQGQEVGTVTHLPHWGKSNPPPTVIDEKAAASTRRKRSDDEDDDHDVE
jgi:hypothetical protein